MLEVALPHPDNMIAAGLQIGILRFIVIHSLALAVIRFGEILRVSMPIIAVKLNSQIQAWHKSIYTELIVDKILRFIIKTKAIEKLITNLFRSGWAYFLLLTIHIKQSLATVWISITALKGAVSRISLLNTGWRPLKLLTANLADKFQFVLALPFYLMLKATKIVLIGFEASLRQVERLATPFTFDFFASTSLFATAYQGTFKGTVYTLAINHLITFWTRVIAGTCANNATLHRTVFASIWFSAGASVKVKLLTASLADTSLAGLLAGCCCTLARTIDLFGGHPLGDFFTTTGTDNASFTVGHSEGIIAQIFDTVKPMRAT